MSAKHAVSVLLVRPHIGSGLEVLMVRRPLAIAPGNAYAFPGGIVNNEDCSEEVLRRCVGLDPMQARDILGKDLSPEISLGHWVAGIRNLFQQVGLLLCSHRDGESTSPAPRKQCEATFDFRALLKSEGLYCDAARLGYYSRWLIFEEITGRLDTRFFLTLLSPDQNPDPNPQEIADSLWLTPERSLSLCQQGKLSVSFPTFGSLRTLADFDSPDALASEYGIPRKS